MYDWVVQFFLYYTVLLLLYCTVSHDNEWLGNKQCHQQCSVIKVLFITQTANNKVLLISMSTFILQPSPEHHMFSARQFSHLPQCVHRIV